MPKAKKKSSRPKKQSPPKPPQYLEPEVPIPDEAPKPEVPGIPLRELEAVLELTTPGPWTAIDADRPSERTGTVVDGSGRKIIDTGQHGADALFIALSKKWMAALIAELRLIYERYNSEHEQKTKLLAEQAAIFLNHAKALKWSAAGLTQRANDITLQRHDFAKTQTRVRKIYMLVLGSEKGMTVDEIAKKMRPHVKKETIRTYLTGYTKDNRPARAISPWIRGIFYRGGKTDKDEQLWLTHRACDLKTRKLVH